MDDLISRAAAIEAIYNSMRHGEGYKAICTRAIERIPAVDAMPVVHGRWSEVAMDIVCSNCKAAYNSEVACLYGGEIDLQRFNGFEYCPHCGAMMDGGTEI